MHSFISRSNILKDFVIPVSQQEITKVISFSYKMAEKLGGVSKR